MVGTTGKVEKTTLYIDSLMGRIKQYSVTYRVRVVKNRRSVYSIRSYDICMVITGNGVLLKAHKIWGKSLEYYMVNMYGISNGPRGR